MSPRAEEAAAEAAKAAAAKGADEAEAEVAPPAPPSPDESVAEDPIGDASGPAKEREGDEEESDEKDEDEDDELDEEVVEGGETSDPPAATPAHFRDPDALHRAIPSAFETPSKKRAMPSSRLLRFLSYALAAAIPATFYLGPLMVALPPFLYPYSPKAALILLAIDAALMTYPTKPWPAFRRVFQLWYHVFDLRHNLSVPRWYPSRPPAGYEQYINDESTSGLYIYAMHPHGIIPMQGYLWCAFCDQYLEGQYGFGAGTDAVMRLPILRQMLGWLSCGTASREVLTDGLTGRGENLWVSPGGVAEIFLAKPGRNAVMKPRRGLMKLALRTGACLIPIYVFGGNDFYHQLATHFDEGEKDDDGGDADTDGGGGGINRTPSSGSFSSTLGRAQQQISRRVRAGFTFWWGRWGTTMPLKSKCSFVLGDPIETVPGTMGEEYVTGPGGRRRRVCRRVPNPTDEQVEELMGRYTDALRRLFDQYKAAAGCPDAELEIH